MASCSPGKAHHRPPPVSLHRRRSLLALLTAGMILLPAPGRFPSIPARAEEPASPPRPTVHRLGLQEILQRGLDASPKLWEQRYLVDQAKAQVGQAKAGRLPRLDYLQVGGVVPEAKGDAVYSPSERSDLFEGLGPFTRLELNVNQPIYTFGKLKAHIEAAEKGLEEKHASLERFKGDLVKTLKELYYTMLLNEDLYRLVSNTEKEMGKAVEKAEELLEDDDASLTQQDLLKLRYGYARASAKRLELEKGRRLVHAALLRLLYLPPGEDFTLKERRLKPVKITLRDLEAYKKMATENRPAWKQLEAGVRAKEAELAAEKKGYFPDIFVTGTVRYAVAPNRDKQENPFVLDEFNYFWGGVFFGWRLALDFGMPQRIAEKKAELAALQQKQRDATSGMLLEVEKAYEDVIEKKESLKFARKAKKSGRALSAMSAANFYLGLGEAKDVFEAFQIYTEGAARYYLAVKDFNMAVAELARVTGVLRLE